MSCDMWLAGLDRPVRLLNCAGLDDALAAVFCAWDYRITEAGHPDPLATLAHAGERFRLTSPFADGPTFHRTAVNALCDLVALLPSAAADADAETLWLHAAATRIAGRAVLFPAVRRSGKSLLSVALAARGAPILGDDVVGVTARQGTAPDVLAAGVAPRLRLPLPDGIDPALVEFAQAHAGPDNGQYRFVPVPGQPERGAALPPGAVVLLDRRDAGPARLEPASRGEVMKRLLHQHFTRDRDSAVVMAALYELASATCAWTLRYCAPGAAADLLIDRAGDLFPKALPAPVTLPAAAAAPAAAPLAERPYRRAPAADLRELDGAVFAVASDGSRIVSLDEGARRLWALLAEPAAPGEAAAILQAAFPATDPDQIARDTRATFERFLSLGLIG